MAAGILYLVATPIGNLEDITLRALRVLKEVDLVAAEDTRHSRKLFNHFGIATSLTSFFQHNEAAKGERIIELLRQGKSVALISDAGTPAISDPGYLLVCRCREERLPVTAVPGPSAVVVALSLSGLPVSRFAFDGFLPARSSARREMFAGVARECRRTVAFYEAPHRLLAALQDLRSELGDERQIAVARELTKIHEELFRGTVVEALEHFGQNRVRGEIVLMIAPALLEPPQETVREALRRLQADNRLSRREIVKQVARQFGLPGSEVYQESLDMNDEMEDLDG
ncbi:MAG: 16S rRNA (cytidine(1402)-2'-O)-methyltransferase [Desulfuromonadaceae bacterium GWC2_58_13]|nr:MAG: 16S rRNA (cytidine(1402)-2'-O)-methyltransferase [Desulfuromonadaceae bacterium GWC2_58_13]